MTQRVKKILVRLDFIEKEHKKINKQVEREKSSDENGKIFNETKQRI